MQVFNTKQLNSIITALKDNKAVIIPTDTVWGVIALNQEVIYEVKERPSNKKISVFIDDLVKLNLPKHYYDVIKNYVPGGLSIVWKDISYRIPANDFIINIVKQVGPVYQSSANISGKTPIVSLDEAQQVFENKSDKVVIVQPLDNWKISNVSSTIINLDNLTLVRQGPIDGQKIINELKKGVS